MIPGRPIRALPLLALAAVTAGGAALAASDADTAGAQASANAGQHVVRTNVALPVARKRLGRWKPLVMRRGAKVGFRRVGGETILRLADRPGRGGYVAVTTSLGGQSAVGEVADVNLARQRLTRGGSRALVGVDSSTGQSIQAGVVRLRGRHLRWAIWHKTDADARDGMVVSRARATMRRWHRLELITQWARPGARAILRVDGRVVARATHRDLTGVLAKRATVGLGRPTSEDETGLMLVRSARVKAAVGRSTVSPSGARGGGGGGGSSAPAPAANPQASLPGRVLMTADFETGDLSQWDSVQRVSSDRIQVVGSPVRQGSRAGKFTVHAGDDPLGGNFGDRAEVSLDTNESEGDERWYAWSTMVGTDMPRTGQFQVISQWHSRANGQPPVAFFAENDSLVLMIHPHSSPGNLIRYVRAWSGPLRRGEWQDITMHVKWSGSDSVGFVELWINGARQTFSNGSQTMHIRTTYPGISNYFKQGYYRQFGISQSGTVYHDGFRMNAAG